MTSSAPTLPRKVLLVEDDSVQVKAYRAVAQRHGMQLEVTARSSEVLRLALSTRPDAIILDYELEDGKVSGRFEVTAYDSDGNEADSFKGTFEGEPLDA